MFGIYSVPDRPLDPDDEMEEFIRRLDALDEIKEEEFERKRQEGR